MFPIAHHVAGRMEAGKKQYRLRQIQNRKFQIPNAAVRQPLKGQSDTDKVSVVTAGWHEDANGKWYQNADGTYYANGFQDIDGTTYSFDENGYMQTGWITKGDNDILFQ